MSPFAYYIYKRLMERLICIKEEEREDYILKNMIYLNDINRRNINISRRIFNYKIPLDHIFIKSFLDIKINEITRNSRENLIVIGNPPYNSEFGQGVRPIYNLFIEKCINDCKILSFIIPAKWFVGAGKGLLKFKQMMLSRTDISMIKEFKDSTVVFPDVKLAGGVCYFIVDKDYNGKCNFNGNMINLNDKDNLTDNTSDSIVQKVKRDKMLIHILRRRGYYGIETNDPRMHTDKREEDIKCYVSKFKGDELYINRAEIKKEIDRYKILTPRASFGENGGFGRIFISDSYEVHSSTFISFRVNSEKEAISLLSYLKTSFVNYLLTLLKKTQDISEKTLSYIPLVPLIFEEESIEWTDDLLFEYFGLDEKEQEIILNHTMRKDKAILVEEPRNKVEESRNKVEEPRNKVGGLDKDKLLNSRGRGGYSREELKKECEKRNMRVLTRYTKKDLVELLLKPT